MGIADSTATTIRSTVSAVAGGVGGLFDATAPVHRGELVFDDDANLPGRTSLFKAGTRSNALVRVAPRSQRSAIRSVCIRIPDAYGPGDDQDFLLASSADGVPFHHATLPARQVGDRLYSSLWLYLAGLQPALFGVRAVGPDRFDFLIAGVLSRFTRVGTLTVDPDDVVESPISFAASNSGGGIHPLPPVAFYRG